MTADAEGWRPTLETAVDTVPAGLAAGLHGLLDAPGPPPGDGDPVPPLWHCVAFLARVPQRDIGQDGHPHTGGFLPPVGTGRRRMFAGAQLSFPVPALVGEPLRRDSEVKGVEEKSGRSGDLTFVTVEHAITGAAGIGIVERQDIVYRHPAPPGGSSATTPDPESGQSWTWELALGTDPALLFRYSALTYNAHRIHYDRPYVTEVEGYPGLVVQGPLQAMALAEVCRRHLPDRRVASFRFRSMRPAFDGPPLRICGRLGDDDNVELVALDRHGRVTTRAAAGLAPL